MKGTAIVLFVVAVVVLVGVAARFAENEVERVTLRIVNLECPCDVEEITAALMAVPGVRSAQVDFDARLASIEYESESCGSDDLQAALEDKGYETIAVGPSNSDGGGVPQDGDRPADGLDVQFDARI